MIETDLSPACAPGSSGENPLLFAQQAIEQGDFARARAALVGIRSPAVQEQVALDEWLRRLEVEPSVWWVAGLSALALIATATGTLFH